MASNPKRRPTHPGALLREAVLPAADIAHRLGRVFGNGPELWLNMQRAVDLWEAERENRAEYARIRPLKQAA